MDDFSAVSEDYSEISEDYPDDEAEGTTANNRPGPEEFHVTVFVPPALAWAMLEAGDAGEAARTIDAALWRMPCACRR
jgi:hypothetical protein